MPSVSPTSGPSGLTIKTEEVLITCTDALSRGDVVMLTLASGGFAACTKSATADTTPDHIIGVALEAVAAGAVGRIALKGIVEAACEDDMDASLCGTVSPSTAGRLKSMTTNPTTDGTAYLKVVAIALEATGSAGDLTSVMFDGINGFGSTSN